ncbi:hypothetical protein niasHT_001420 [Heterodera trifolii]|uniref:14-3-3 protein n=1 Tax=Heterodera trifolii TaxID=157864 RepID=A0ABD2LRQ7_9BILA
MKGRNPEIGDHANNQPGYSYCVPSCGGWHCKCFLATDGFAPFHQKLVNVTEVTPLFTANGERHCLVSSLPPLPSLPPPPPCRQLLRLPVRADNCSACPFVPTTAPPARSCRQLLRLPCHARSVRRLFRAMPDPCVARSVPCPIRAPAARSVRRPFSAMPFRAATRSTDAVPYRRRVVPDPPFSPISCRPHICAVPICAHFFVPSPHLPFAIPPPPIDRQAPSRPCSRQIRAVASQQTPNSYRPLNSRPTPRFALFIPSPPFVHRSRKGQALDLAKNKLRPMHPIRLTVALNFAILQFEVQKSPADACQTAQRAYDEATSDAQTTGDSICAESVTIMELLQDNISYWSGNTSKTE